VMDVELTLETAASLPVWDRDEKREVNREITKVRVR